MRIPLPKLMRHWRERAFEAAVAPAGERFAVRLWAWTARRPWLYGLGARLAAWLLAWLGRKRGRLSWLPLAGGWTDGRDLPVPEGRTFQARWRAERRRL